MRYWLMKSEPSECSVDDVLAMPEQTVAWYGVRNYQARNFMRDQMRLGDGVFFYHSNCAEPGIVGLAELRRQPELERMRILQRGNRLSITPLDPAEWRFICERLLEQVAAA